MTTCTQSDATQRSRFERAPVSKIQVTDRDQQIFVDLYRHRCLTRKQIQSLHFPSTLSCQARLRKLFDHRYLARTFPYTPAGRGSAQAIYFLTEKSASRVARRMGKDLKELSWEVETTPNNPFLEHTLAVNDVVIKSKLAAQGRGIPFEYRIHSEARSQPRYHWDMYGPKKRKFFPFNPDAVLFWEDRATFLEVDMGTERRGFFEEKVRQWIKYCLNPWGPNLCSEDWGSKDYHCLVQVMLVVTTSQRRLKTLAEIVANIVPRENPFLKEPPCFLTTFEELQNGSLFGANWHEVEEALSPQHLPLSPYQGQARDREREQRGFHFGSELAERGGSKMAFGIRFRRKSKDELSPIRLRETDLQIIDDVYAFRFLTSSHLASLYHYPIGSARRRLRQLYDHRYLDRIQLPVYAGMGSPEVVHCLDSRGKKLLEEKGKQKEVHWSKGYNRVKPPFIRRILAINDFLVFYWIGKSDRGCTPHREASCSHPRPRSGKIFHYKPSAVLWRDDWQDQIALLHFDNGLYSIKRHYKHLRRWLTYVLHGWQWEDWGMGAVCLFVAYSQARTKRLFTRFRKLRKINIEVETSYHKQTYSYKGEYCYLASLEEIKRSDFTDPIWLSLKDGERVSINEVRME